MWNTAQERCDLHFKCEHIGCNISCTFWIYPGWLASVSLAQRLHVFAETSSASEWDAYPAVWWEEGRAVDTRVTLMYTNTATYTFQGSKHVLQLPTAIRSPSRECPTLDAVAASLGLFSPVWHMTACNSAGIACILKPAEALECRQCQHCICLWPAKLYKSHSGWLAGMCTMPSQCISALCACKASTRPLDSSSTQEPRPVAPVQAAILCCTTLLQQ